jgi:hypothetical protein
MKVIETSFEQVPEGFIHNMIFEFEGRSFSAVVVETENETYIRDCYQVLENLFPIDIPKYFGEFKSDVYSFIYENIQQGYPDAPETQTMASSEGLMKVDWFDYAKQETITQEITQDQLEWLQKQPHIEVEKINDQSPAEIEIISCTEGGKLIGSDKQTIRDFVDEGKLKNFGNDSRYMVNKFEVLKLSQQ